MNLLRVPAIVFVLWVAGLTAAAQFAKFSVLFSDIQAIYPEYGTQVGFLVSVIGLLGIVLGLFAGMLVAVIGYRRILITSLLFGAGISWFQSFLPDFEWMLFSRILEGLSHLAIVVSAPTLIGQLSKGPYQGFAMTLWSTFFGVAFALVAWFGIPLSAAQGPGTVFAVHGSVMFCTGLVLLVFLPGDKSEAENFPLNVSTLIGAHFRAYSSAFISAPAWGWLFYTLCFVSLLTVLPTLVPAENRANVAGLMPMASIGLALVTGLVLLRFLNPINTILIGFGVSIIVLVFIWLGAGLGLFAVVLFGTLGLVQGASFASIPYLNPRAEDQALANGALAQAGNLGNTLGTPMFLIVLDLFSITGLITTTAFLFCSAIATHGFLAWKRREIITREY